MTTCRCGAAAEEVYVVARWHNTPQAGTGAILDKEIPACETKACKSQARSTAFIYSLGWDPIRDQPTRKPVGQVQEVLF
jgi:hypothetical protein